MVEKNHRPVFNRRKNSVSTDFLTNFYAINYLIHNGFIEL